MSVVDEQLVRRLLIDQHPDLSTLPLRAVASGWDNIVFRLGEKLVVRLPRRSQAAQLILNEQRWLSEVAAETAVAVPVPQRAGTPCAYYPWPWSVCPWFDGEQAAVVPLHRRTAAAAELADFVAAVHRPAPAEAPLNPVRGVALATRSESVMRRLGSGAFDDERRLGQLWEQLRGTPEWSGPALWLHGDLHPANILLSGGRLRAVLDFGDLTSGDPATDLATAWLTFDEAGRRVFMERANHLHNIDADTWSRARGWALNIATAMLEASEDHPALRRTAHEALRQVL